MGIIGKIWNIVDGSRGRSGGAQIGSSIDYITNDEKCSGEIDLYDACQIGREVSYVTNDIKTLQGLYVGARHISDVTNAVDEMMQVKEFYKKLDGRVALHGIISLDEEESDERNAGKLMLLLDEFLAEVYPDNQVVYAVHTNTENLHIHFIANSVGLDGKKIHMDKKFMRHVFEPTLNRLAVKYGFTPNEVWKKEQGKDEVSFKDRKIMLRKAVDLAIEEADDFVSFVNELKGMGLTVNVGKHISLRMDGMVKAVRSGQLGEEYTIAAIKERIANKKAPLIELHIKHHVKEIKEREVVNYLPSTLKKYKEMSVDEKKRTVELLRMGRNPWRERYETNWAIQKMSVELKSQAHVYDIIHHFSPEKLDVMETKEAIIELQKEIANERKAIKQNLKKYKPIINLYEEAKKYEIRAYLYEFADCKEYASDYEAYKELCRRLEENYGKSIEEVALFCEEQTNELLYAKAQSNELSQQYKAVLKYENEATKDRTNETVSFFDAVGHSAAFIQARDYGIYETRLVMITSEEAEDIRVRVMTTPGVVDGKSTVVTTVTLLDKENHEIEVFSSSEMGRREFNSRLNDLKHNYGFIKCHVEKIKESTYMSQKERGKRK